MQPFAPAPTSAASDRLHGLDALRGFALLLGIVLHAVMAYMPGSQYFWIISDTQNSPVLSGVFFWIHSFRMTLFFLLAGFFGRMALQRLGLGGFLRDRRRRIVMPLVVGWPIVFAAIVAALSWATWVANGGAFPEGPTPPAPSFMPDDFPLTHLWFLYVLVLFYAAILALRGVARVADSRGRIARILDTALRLGVTWTAWPLLAIPVAAALFVLPQWYLWFGIPTPDKSLYPNLAASTAYGLAFAVGWLLQRQPALLGVIARRWPLNLAIAVIAWATCVSIAGWVSPATPAAGDATTLGYAFAYGVCGWAWSFALIGLALRFASGYSPTRRYLADASYWMYLAHLPLVMAAQVVAFQLSWPWWVELPLLLAAVVSILLATYQLLVRHRAIGRALNGTMRGRVPDEHARIDVTAVDRASGPA
jgi:glucan biosynthesis protein C